jgi:hypothetical protein
MYHAGIIFNLPNKPYGFFAGVKAIGISCQAAIMWFTYRNYYTCRRRSTMLHELPIKSKPCTDLTVT